MNPKDAEGKKLNKTASPQGAVDFSAGVGLDKKGW